MDNNDNKKLKKYELFTIGYTKIEDSKICIYVLPKYKSALKYLDLFSHVLLFFKKDKEKSFRNHQNNINVTTAKILNINENGGIIWLNCKEIKQNTVVVDLKPYFPCEDRVKDFIVPDSIRDMPKWLNVENTDNNNLPTSNFINDLTDKEIENKFSIEQIGNVNKREGEYFLKLNRIDQKFLENLNQYSHIRILWWFDKFDKNNYRMITECNPPYENAPRSGVFATRSPVRPNPIAVTTAKILNVDFTQNIIKVSHMDSFDKTPIIDIVPYIPAEDRVKEYKVPQWLEHWPEWLDDREDNLDYEDITILDTNIDRINQYSQIQENRILEVDKLFEQEIQKLNSFSDEIIVKGARQNNLKNINLSIPKNKITVITGVSGSGKSSLAFDTIYAESQRRFMDSMSTSSKLVFNQMDKADFDKITGLPPAISIEQKTLGRNPRSTVGTTTDIYDYLKLLFAKIGTRHCAECGYAITPLKIDQIVHMLTGLKPNTVFNIRAFNKETIIEEFVIPEIVENKDIFLKNVKECVKDALSTGSGAIIVEVNNNDEFLFQTKEMCYNCNKIFFELTTSTFSFNNPESMCPVCKGLGVKLEVDVDLIVSNPDISILDGASEWWGDLRKHREKPNANWMRGEILALAGKMGVDLELPWNQLPEKFKHQALYGSQGEEVSFVYENSNGRRGEIVRPVEGAYNIIVRLFSENNGETSNKIVAKFMKKKLCNGCHGERLSAEGRLVSIANTRFPETVIMTIDDLMNWIKDLPNKLTDEQLEISKSVLIEIYKKLNNLVKVGVPYLSLDRSIPTLSGGESQRIRLATQCGSGITNILYVLDEPSIGLHPKDHKNLVNLIKDIKGIGNTVLIVEHDADTMLSADKIIDIGPGAGIEGGIIVAEGTPEEIMENSKSDTGKYLYEYVNGKKTDKKSTTKPNGWIKLIGAKHNNLKNIDVNIPLGVLTCITGVSGSGKSSLVSETLYPALAKILNLSVETPGKYDSLEGCEEIDNIIDISQHPIGRTPRSNPATYTGVFDEIRKVFAQTDEAKKRGYKQNRFSFNSKEGRCEACDGEGRKCIQMHFMPDIWVECSVCNGSRYNKETLEVKYNSVTISDVLNMNIEESLEFFNENKKIKNILQTLCDVGLGYIKLGQSALTLSGGEAQRVKLAKELSKKNTGKTIYLLDEPTTGLHFSDIKKLIDILHRITEAGNTVLVIEHNLDIIENADWIIDLGPSGGKDGGYVIAQGTPEEVAKVENSYTGKML